MPVDVCAAVTANQRLSADYNVIALTAPQIAAAVEPGQFVMVKPGRGYDPLLRRPFSVFEILRDSRDAPTGISILNKRIGVSTGLLYDAAPEQSYVSCFGPLGRPFTIVTPPTEAWMVAGGVGLAPFATLAQALCSRGVRCTLFYGARRRSELFYTDFFVRLGVGLVLTTEDGSGSLERGRIIAPLERRLAGYDPDRPLVIYACGPEGMLAACAKIADRFRRPCQVSVERVMACGMGGCYSCVVPMRSENGAVHHVRSCLSGPVLAADQIVWDSVVPQR
jgi:dihydroorotate dehydrogenase electron transfer subunit